MFFSITHGVISKVEKDIKLEIIFSYFDSFQILSFSRLFKKKATVESHTDPVVSHHIYPDQRFKVQVYLPICLTIFDFPYQKMVSVKVEDFS